MYREDCKGCHLSQGHGSPRGSIVVELDDYWILNHYDGKEGFLGWMALQPKEHRMDLAELTSDEVAALGKNIQRIDLALRCYWDCHFNEPIDAIERVYVVYFFESYWDDPKKHEWHLHIHLIPRTRAMVGNRLPSEVAAWLTPYLAKQDWFPPRYQILDKSRKRQKNAKEVRALMNYLKLHLGK